MLRKLKMNLCECGCGQACHNRFVRGHNNNSYWTKEKRIEHSNQMKDYWANNKDKRDRITKKLLLFYINNPQACKDISDRMSGSSNPMYNIGANHPMLGKRHTEETKLKMRKKAIGRLSPMKGKNHSDKTRKKLCKSLKGRKVWNKGKTLSLKHRESLSISRKLFFKDPENVIMHSCIRQGISREDWNGFVSTEPYCDAWADKEYKESIKERDNYTCQNPDCWKNCEHLSLTIHHIDYDK